MIIVRLDNLLATKGAIQAPINVASPTKLVPIFGEMPFPFEFSYIYVKILVEYRLKHNTPDI
jgi:hypothetical protein